jgi:hypothetical protein
MKLGKPLNAALATTALLVALLGCQRQEGPAEQAGKKLDNAMDQTGQNVDSATEKLGEKVEQAGENIQDAAQDDKK